ncbi:MAG: lipid II flippase MurJ [Betaproteobacteria bacterium]|nr:hypothetical protein [Rubrivivax sp.]
MQVSLILGLLAVLQIISGLAGQLIVLRLVGVGLQTDAYIAAQTVPNILFSVVAASLHSLWLPRLSRAAQEPASFREEVRAAQGQCLTVMALTCAGLWLSSFAWVSIAFPGFGPAQSNLVVLLSTPLFIQTALMAHTGILTAALRARGRFLVAEVSGLTLSVVGIVLLFWLVPYLGIVAAAWIAAGRAAIVLVVLSVYCGMPGFCLRSSASGREVAGQIRSLVGSGLFIKSGPLVDRFWSSQGSAGSVTVLSMAQLAINSLATVLERALLVHITPQFARYVRDGNFSELRSLYVSSLLRIGGGVAAVGALFMFGRPIVDWLLQSLLLLSPAAASEVWLICLVLLPSLFVAISGSAAVAVFYAFGETRLPSLIGLGGFMLSVALKALLFWSHGIVGLAAAASICFTMTMIVYHAAVMRRIAAATKTD